MLELELISINRNMLRGTASVRTGWRKTPFLFLRKEKRFFEIPKREKPKVKVKDKMPLRSMEHKLT
ncbi:MAG: hypothetical protein RSD48_05830, partial [Oscillospiraceae bacterium]